MITQILSLGALALVALIGWKVYQAQARRQEYSREEKRQAAIAQEEKRLELARQQVAIDFHRIRTQGLQVAIMQGADYRVHHDGVLEVKYPQPVQPRATQVTEEKQSGQLQLMAPGIRQPMQRFLLDQLEENMLQVSPGVRTADGQPIILSIVDAVHFKLIGSSGFGKSCLAAALLDQAIRLNSPDLLQVALLDLEHKTSRLFENSPNVATLQVGRRSVPMVATSADEVAAHLSLLRKELDRRALLSEYDLQREALLLMYVEEMLSLQFEIADELIDQMLKDLSVLAVRARKYNMFLLACAQTDYSTPELRTAQKQFRSRMAFAIDTTAARAAGFMSTELIKYSFSHSQRGDGLYVLETPGVASLMLAPVFDVRAKVLAIDSRSRPVQTVFNAQPLRVVNSERTSAEQTLQAKRDEVFRLRSEPYNWGKIAIIEKVWNVKRGGSLAWRQAEAEYNQMVDEMEVEEA